MHWRNEKLTLNVADGTQMNALAVVPEGKSLLPSLILLHEAFGVNSHIEKLANQFAEAGYLTLAPHLFHRTAQNGFACAYDQIEKARPHMSALTESGIQDDVQACFQWLTERGSRAVGVIGWCMGGRAAFVANARGGIKCSISFYGGRIGTDHLHLCKEQKSPLLLFWGGRDEGIPQEQVQTIARELKSANKTFVSVEFSDADHGFFCDERASFNDMAKRQSLALALEFLKDNLNKN